MGISNLLCLGGRESQTGGENAWPLRFQCRRMWTSPKLPGWQFSFDKHMEVGHSGGQGQVWGGGGGLDHKGAMLQCGQVLTDLIFGANSR